GLPGFGSNVLFVPDRDLAVFAFANRTYAPASRVVRDAANLLIRSGAFPARTTGPSAGLATALAAALHVYRTGDVASEPAIWAMNVYLDREPALRNADIAALRARLGDCTLPPGLAADNPMSGTFDLPCERGMLKVALTLAPTVQPTIQKLE